MIDSALILEALNRLAEIGGPGSPVCACVTDENGFVRGYIQTGDMNSRSSIPGERP